MSRQTGNARLWRGREKGGKGGRGKGDIDFRKRHSTKNREAFEVGRLFMIFALKLSLSSPYFGTAILLCFLCVMCNPGEKCKYQWLSLGQIGCLTGCGHCMYVHSAVCNYECWNVNGVCFEQYATYSVQCQVCNIQRVV